MNYYLQQIGSQAENEHCSLFLINYDGLVKANPREMDEVRWLTFEDLSNWFEMEQQQCTPWFAEAFRRMMRPQAG
ncbi:MAG: hypothetical protein HKP57_07980 [Halobacteria archaeon]|nr:hypothetical protein [Halobacteria archaeon]